MAKIMSPIFKTINVFLNRIVDKITRSELNEMASSALLCYLMHWLYKF